MRYDQNNKEMFFVVPLYDDEWNVYERSSKEALATFDTEQDAYDYANALAAQKDEAEVIVEEN